MVDITQFFDLKEKAIISLEFQLNSIKNVGISMMIEDKNKALLKRLMNSQRVAYDGPNIEVENLTKPLNLRYLVTLSQTIDLEMDSGANCRIYPNREFSSYHECDESYIYNEMKNTFNIMPFWAAKSLDEVTNNRYRKICEKYSTVILEHHILI